MNFTLQAQYRCPECHKITEKRDHCSHENIPLIRGYTFLNNDRVNQLCTLSGGLLAGLAFLFYVLLIKHTGNSI